MNLRGLKILFRTVDRIASVAGTRALRRSAWFVVCSLSLVALQIGVAPRAFAASWEWLSPTPTGNHFNSFAYGGGRFVGVGNMGEIATSSDGAAWTLRDSGVNDRLARVVYDRARFWAVGGTNLLSSTDGVAWTKQPASATLLDLAAGNNVLVAVATPVSDGQPYRLLTSTDGVTWSAYACPGQPQRIFFTNGVFVAVDIAGRALSSSDGTAWTSTPVPGITEASFFVAGNGVFLVCSGTQSRISNNGTTWREVNFQFPDSNAPNYPVPVPNLSGGVAGSMVGSAGGYLYVRQSRYALDAYACYRSSDGETWERTPYLGNLDLVTLAAGGGVMVGSELETLYTGPNRNFFAIHSSTDGLTWTSRSTVSLTDDSSLVYGLGRFFAGDKVSSDGLAWVANPFAPTHAAGGLMFRVTSQFPWSTRPSTEIIPQADTSVTVSADGLTSVTVDVKMKTPRAVAYGAGRYVFVGDGGGLSASSDGLTWNTAASGTTADLKAVIFAFNQFVAVGSQGALLTSSDGLAWSVRSTGATVDFLSAVAGPDRFVIGTAGSATPVAALTLSGNVPAQIVTARRSDVLLWFDGEYTSVAYMASDYYSNNASFAKSTDGATWSDLRLNFIPSIKGQARVAAGNGLALLEVPGGRGWSLESLFTAVFQRRLTGSSAPAIVSPPMAMSVTQGETATFGVGATGSGALSYQWKRNGTPIAGATSQILAVALTKDADAGDYSVTVTNAFGSATSAVARLTVAASIPLTITKQPVGGTLFELQSFILSVEVSGSGPITYQWRRNGNPVATTPTYEIWAASYAMDTYVGTYDVVVTAPHSSVTSEAVVVRRSGPVVTVSKSGTEAAGGTLVVTANATGKGPFTYSWNQTKGGPVAGADGASLVLPALTSADTSPYSVTVTDADGISTQAYFTVAILSQDPAPATTTAAAAAGQRLTLRAPLPNTAPPLPTFQWRFKNEPIAGATSWSYTTPALSEATAGDYAVVVTSASGATTTYTTTVSLGGAIAAPAFVAQTSSRTVAAGQATTFSVSAGGAQVASYQWQVSTNGGSTWTNLTDGAPYSGTTSATLTISAATTAMTNYQYRCVATNSGGSATSAAAILSINNDPLLNLPVAVARDSSGTLFVADASANVIRQITSAGVVSTLAGTVGSAGSSDGTGAAARFNQPGGVALDGAGNLYVADAGNATIRKITAAGVVTTLAGDPAARGNVDATGSSARFSHPAGLALDGAGNVFVADSFTHTIRKITPAGVVTTFAGSNAATGSADGAATVARFSRPTGVAVDASGAVYVADTGNHTIRKITTSGAVGTLAGLPGVSGANDGTGSGASFSQPAGLVVDASGTVFVADTGNALIRRVTSSGVVSLMAGVPGIAGLADGVGLDALLDQPRGLALDSSGNLLVADAGNAALRKITTARAVSTLTLSAATTPTTPSNPNPPAGSSGGTTSPSTSAGSGGGNGGGGAINPWVAAGVLALAALRHRQRRKKLC